MTDHEKACFDRAASELAKRGAHGEANLADALTKLGAALLESDAARAAEREHADRLAEALAEYAEHDSRCILSRYSAGRPTTSGGYEMEYGGQWYEVKPVDRRPACECGLSEAIAAHDARRQPATHQGKGPETADEAKACMARTYPRSNLHNAYECIESLSGQRVFNVIGHNPYVHGHGDSWTAALLNAAANYPPQPAKEGGER